MLQEAVARRYNFRGPFDPELISLMENPIQRELVMRSLEFKTIDEKIYELLGDDFPEFLKSLFDVHGTVLANVHGAKVKGLFKRKDKSLPDGVSAVYRLPNGELVGVTE